MIVPFLGRTFRVTIAVLPLRFPYISLSLQYAGIARASLKSRAQSETRRKIVSETCSLALAIQSGPGMSVSFATREMATRPSPRHSLQRCPRNKVHPGRDVSSISLSLSLSLSALIEERHVTRERVSSGI